MAGLGRGLVALAVVALLVMRGGVSRADDPGDGPTGEEQAQSEVAHMILGLPGTLRVRYPDAYGGVVAESNLRWVIGVVDSAAGADALRDDVAAAVAESIARVGASITFVYRSAPVSMARLEAVQAEISRQLADDAVRAESGIAGVGMDGVGLKVMARPGRERDVLARLELEFPDVAITVQAADGQLRTTGPQDVAVPPRHVG